MNSVLLVAAGGFLGASARYLLGKYINKVWKGDFPLGTFLINIAGSFLLGLVIFNPVLAVSLSNDMSLGLGLGFLGSFTTFSTLEYETLQLLEKRKWRIAFTYVLFSFVIGFITAKVALLL